MVKRRATLYSSSKDSSSEEWEEEEELDQEGDSDYIASDAEDESEDEEQEEAEFYTDDEFDDEPDEEEGDEEAFSDIEEDEVEEEEEEEQQEEEEEFLPLDVSRPSSTIPTDEATTEAIISSVQNVLPELGSIPKVPIVNTPVSLRMTDLGFKISQMVLNRQAPSATGTIASTGPTDFTGLPASLVTSKSNQNEGLGEDEEEEIWPGEQDPYVEKALSRRRRNRTGIRGRPKKVDYGLGKSTTLSLPPQVARLMGQANICYVARQYDEAIAKLLEVVRQAPSAVEAYQTLAMIHEERNDLPKALSYYIIAAHLVRTDAELWCKLAKLTLAAGRKAEAIYYLGRLIRMKETREEYFWMRAWLLVEREEYRRAILGLAKLLMLQLEGDGSVFRRVDLLARRLNVDYAVGPMFEQVIEEAATLHQRLPSISVTVAVLETFLKKKEYPTVLALVDRLAVPYCESMTQTSLPTSWYSMSDTERLRIAQQSMPVELRLFQLIARIYSERGSTIPQADFDWLRALDGRIFGFLLKLVGRAFLDTLAPERALQILFPLMEIPAMGDVSLGIMLGECYKLIPGADSVAISTFEAILEMAPGRQDVRMALADLYRAAGRNNDAARLIAESTTNDEMADWNSTTTDATGQEMVTPLVNPCQEVEKAFTSIFCWDSATFDLPSLPPPLSSSSSSGMGPTQAIVMQERISTRHSDRRRRTRRRIRKFSSYTSSQMKVIQEEYRRILLLYSDAEILIREGQRTGEFIQDTQRDYGMLGSIELDPGMQLQVQLLMRQVRHLAQPLIRDMLTNAVLRSAEGKKRLARTDDLGLLHGLKVEEWFAVLIRYLVAEQWVGSVERALRLVRLFSIRSIFNTPSFENCNLRLRMINFGLVQLQYPNNREESDYIKDENQALLMLSGTRWFLVHWPNFPLTIALIHQILHRYPINYATNASRINPYFRFLQRQDTPTAAYLSLLFFCLSERWESALAVAESLLSKLSVHPTVLVMAAVAMFHQSTKRTCHNPAHLQKLAFACLGKLLSLAIQKDDDDDKSNSTDNKRDKGRRLIEAQFNMGRALHMMGRLDMAVIWYRRVLRANNDGYLKEEAAFNLHLIALLMGEASLASYYLSMIEV